MRQLRNVVGMALGICFLSALLYAGVAQEAFAWRNPKANEQAFFLHFWAAMKFERLPQFQE